MNTLKNYLSKAEDFLRNKKVEKPRLEAQILFAHCLNLQRYELYTNDHLPLQQEEIDDLRQWLMRKAAGEPTAYIIEKKEFFSLPLYVNSDVLIPRPETEELVEIFLKQFSLLYKPSVEQQVLDLCCGSGAIGLAILSKLPQLTMCFADVSAKAVSVCKKNFAELFSSSSDKQSEQTEYNERESQADFFVGNLFDEPTLAAKKFAAIVSNPPYVTQEEFKTLAASVKDYEPSLALQIPEEKFFEKLFAQSYSHLNEGGLFYMETNPLLITTQKKQLQEQGFKNVQILNDFASKARFLAAER